MAENNLDHELASLNTKNGPNRSQNFIEELRRAGRKGFALQNSRQGFPNIKEIETRLRELSEYNQEIENSIKMEVLGIKEGTFNWLRYKIASLVNRRVSPADEIIESQINRVNDIGRNLNDYCFFIESKVRGLETRYDEIVFSLISRHEESQEILQDLERKKNLMIKTGEAAEEAADIGTKIQYLRAQREVRRKIKSDMGKVKLNDRAVSLLQNELPVLDGLSGIAEAYTFTLREIIQETDLMSAHLSTVCALYIEMARSQRINLGLEQEVGKLSGYTNNMSRALSDGVGQILTRAGNSSFIDVQYSSERVGNFLSRIEEQTFREFGDLEARLDAYSLKGERRVE